MAGNLTATAADVPEERTGWILSRLTPALALVVAGFHLAANFYGLFQPMWQTAMSLALILPYALLMTSSQGSGLWRSRR